MAPQLGTRLPEQVTALLMGGARDQPRLPFCPPPPAFLLCRWQGSCHLMPTSPPPHLPSDARIPAPSQLHLLSFPHPALVPLEPRPRAVRRGAETCSLGTGADCFGCSGRQPWGSELSRRWEGVWCPSLPTPCPRRGVRPTPAGRSPGPQPHPGGGHASRLQPVHEVSVFPFCQAPTLSKEQGAFWKPQRPGVLKPVIKEMLTD